MRVEPSVRDITRSSLGALGAALLFAAAHAALIKLGRGAPWSAAVAFAATNAVLWFVAAPAAMALGRRLGRDGHALRWQFAIGLVCAPVFGVLQDAVAIAVGLRAFAPALASLFYYLDLNVAVLVLAAVALDLYAGRNAMARQSRRYLALEARLLEVRHDLLTLQLQPHFLFNALNSVVELVRESPSEAARVLRNLRTLLLATTERSSQVAVSLADELDVVDAFIGVARARHADTLSFTREVDDDALAASVPPLTLAVAANRATAELEAPFVAAPPPAEPSVSVFTDEFAATADPLGESAPPHGLRRWLASLHPAVVIAGFWTLAWVFWVFQMHFYRMARTGTMNPSFSWGLADLVSAISWMALTPIALYLGRRFPVRGEHLAPTIAVHVAGALGATVVNISVVIAVFGLSMVPMNNVLNQVVVNCAIYALLVVWTHAEQIARWFDERRTATRRRQAELARARWEATEMRLSPELIADELERIAARVEVDAAGAEDEVLDMADALRRRLKGSDTGGRERAPAALSMSAIGVLLIASLAAGGCAPSTRTAPPAAPAVGTSASTGTASPAQRPAPNRADVDFMTGMIGHHAQALVMAGWAPSHGASASLRVLAERIVNEQQDEIVTMQNWLRDRGQTVAEAKPGPMRMMMNGVEHDMLMPGMLTDEQMKQLDGARGPEFDRLFLTYMIQHHEGAVSMVTTLFATNGAAQEQSVFKLASDVSADQSTEIARMKKMLSSLTPGGGSR